MSVIDLHYPIAGLVVLAGGIGFMKFFDFLASQSAKRLLEMASSIEQDYPDGNPCK
jgi:hypothetical protein